LLLGVAAAAVCACATAAASSSWLHPRLLTLLLWLHVLAGDRGNHEPCCCSCTLLLPNKLHQSSFELLQMAQQRLIKE
jgi:hypothetical protein